jgi:hypothetical protein
VPADVALVGRDERHQDGQTGDADGQDQEQVLHFLDPYSGPRVNLRPTKFYTNVTIILHIYRKT